MYTEALPLTGPPRAHLRLAPRIWARWLVLCIGGLTLVSVAAHVWRFTANSGRQRWFLMLLDLNSEHSLPTFYQGMTLLLTGLLMGIISMLPRRGANEPNRCWWLLLGIGFIALSMDELCEMHETIGYAVQKLVHPHGYFRYAWVIPGMILAGTIGMVCLRFLFQLPRRTRVRFIVSGAIYLGGAIGVEMISANYAEMHGEENLIYSLISDAEELCEMSGIGILLVCLLGVLSERSAELRLEFQSVETQGDPQVPSVVEKMRRVA